MAEIGSAYVSVLPSARGFGSSLNSQVGPQVNRSGTTIGAGLGKSLLKGFIAIGVATKVAQFLGDSLAEARESQKIGAATTQIIKSTGGAANITADQVGRLSTAISNKTGVDDEAIQTGANLLLTFKNVRDEAGKGNDVFRQATKSAVDLSAAGFGSIDSASKTLGKALNDPVKGISALSRAGVTFTQGQQDQIKAMVANNDVLGAQKIILGEVESQVGGVAAATATNSEKAGVAFGNLKEQIGTALIPGIDALSGAFANKVAPAISGFITGLTSGSGAAGGFSGFIRNNVLPVLSDIGTFIQTKVVPAVRDALGSALKSGKAAFDSIRKAIADNKPEINQIVAFMKRMYTVLYTQVIPAAIRFAGIVVGRLGKAISIGITIVAAIVRAFNGLRDTIQRVGQFVAGAVSFFQKFYNGARDKVQQLFNFVKGVPGKIKSALGNVASLLYDAGKSIIQGLINGLKAAAGALYSAAQAVANRVKDTIKGAFKVNSPSKVMIPIGEAIPEGLAVGMKKGTSKAEKAAKELVKKLRDQLASARSDFASLVEPIAGNFTQGLFDFDNGKDFLANLTTTKGTLGNLLGAFKTLKGFGLNPGFLYQLFQNGGAGLILDLAANKDLAIDAGSTFGQITDLSTQLGTAVAGSTAKGAELEAQTVRLEKKLDKIEKAVKGSARDVGVEINGAASNGRRNGRGGRR